MNRSSSANAALKQASGTLAAALADPSTGSTTSVYGERRSMNPISSESTFTPCSKATSTMASSTNASTHMVGVPSAPTDTSCSNSRRE